MKRTGKFLSLLLALAMICSLFVPAMAADEKKEAPAPYAIGDVKGKLVVLHTNDIHGRIKADSYNKILGMTAVAAMKDQYEKAGASVLVLDAGDTLHGMPILGGFKGSSMVDVMNEVGYTAMTPGNHDFNYGYERLLELKKEMKFPLLAANVTYEKDGKPVFEANTIVEAGSYKVGIFGLATVETMTKTNPNNVKGIKFASGEALYQCAQAQVDALKKAGCNYIIALGHLGVDKGSKGNTSLDVINNTKGIDLFVDGHSHTQISEGKILKDQDLYLDIAKTGDTVLASTGTALANVGVVTYDGKTTTAILRNDVIADTAVGEKVAKYDKDTKEKYKAEVGKSEVNFNTAKAPGNRTMETNMGDFATDAMLYAARKAGYKADLALTNGGGIRPAKALDNPTTMTEYDMVTVFPFGNQVVIFDILGSALLQAVEDNTKSVPASDGGFPQTSGMTYSIDTSATYVEKEVHRVTIETVAGKPFDPKATYSLATNDFVGVGGDNYKVFRDYFQNKMSGIALEDALTAYIKDELKGVVTAEKYGKPAGRITIKYLGVEPGQWYVAAAKQVIDNKIMVSTGKGFDPTGTVTRGTIYQMLFNMEGRPTKDIKASAFTDIAGKWYADAANWAVSAKLLDDTDKTFGEEVITRGELATIIAAYAGYKGIVVATEGMAMKEAPDYATIPAAQLSGMTFCFYGKLMTGDQNKNLNPMGKLTRAEMAQVMYNFAKLPIAYTTEKVEIDVPANGKIPAHKIPAIVTLPAAPAGKVPAVVMLHGTGSNKDEAGNGYVYASRAMAADGIATIRLDFMGNGDSTAEYRNYNYTSANLDAKAAADYMAKLTMVDGKKIGVMGWSQGGTNALLAAAEYPSTFSAVVTWAGATDLSILFSDFEASYATAKKDGGFELEFGWRPALMVGEQWFKEVKETDVLAKVAQIKAPILAIQGDKDTTVLPENATKIIEKAQNKDSSVYTVAGADHTFLVFSGDLGALNQTIAAGSAFFHTQFGDVAATPKAAA